MASKRIRFSSARIQAAQDYEPAASRAPRNALRNAATQVSNSAPNEQLTADGKAQEYPREQSASQPASEHYDDGPCWDVDDAQLWSLSDLLPPPSQRTTAQRNASAAEAWKIRREEQHYAAEWPCLSCETTALRIAHAQDLFQRLEQRAAVCPCCGTSGDEYPIQRAKEVLIVLSDFSLRMALPVRLCLRCVACIYPTHVLCTCLYIYFMV